MGSKDPKTHRKNGGKSTVWRAVLFIICIVGAFFIGYGVKGARIIGSTAIRENTDQYQFIKPLLAVNRDSTAPSPVYKALYQQVNDIIRTHTSSGDVTTASVYFIDYGKNPGSFMINEDERYEPASLLKILSLIAFLKKSESDPSLLDERLTYSPSLESSLEAIPLASPSELKVGQSYTVSDLLNKMIVDSDNGAKDLLLANIDGTYIDQVYKDLNLPPPTGNASYTISDKEYTLLFRVLYNATYLSQVDSEKALSILSKATFADGIVSALPTGTVVAHKYGEYADQTNNVVNSVELHDCGIIYAPNQPYLLCVMTKGKAYDPLPGVIHDISATVYSSISTQK